MEEHQKRLARLIERLRVRPTPGLNLTEVELPLRDQQDWANLPDGEKQAACEFLSVLEASWRTRGYALKADAIAALRRHLQTVR